VGLRERWITHSRATAKGCPGRSARRANGLSSHDNMGVEGEGDIGWLTFFVKTIPKFLFGQMVGNLGSSGYLCGRAMVDADENMMYVLSVDRREQTQWESVYHSGMPVQDEALGVTL